MDKRTGLTAAVMISSIALSLAACEAESRGAKLFRQSQCIECHTIKGKGGAVGPNLTSVGSRRSRDWIVQQIKDPASHKADTVMPSFVGKMPEQDINDLADYLASLK